MKSLSLSILIFLLTGCATVKPTYFDGESVTYQHHKYGFNNVMADAQKQCASTNKLVKHDRTDCANESSICVSSFTCKDKSHTTAK